ncbi:MAG: substrate-binding domain-containing protein, partial [Candidatus Cloacimonetes bacterium]|nr:substrate-binding domain-containing protein [Candidatus Cloacimonadota bacterium]
DEAYDLAKSMFSKHPRVRLLFCANDMMALGAIQYLKEIGRKDVLVASFDNLEEIKPLIEDGSLQASIDQQAKQQGYLGVQTAYQMITGKEVSNNVLIPVKLITSK